MDIVEAKWRLYKFSIYTNIRKIKWYTIYCTIILHQQNWTHNKILCIYIYIYNLFYNMQNIIKKWYSRADRLIPVFHSCLVHIHNTGGCMGGCWRHYRARVLHRVQGRVFQMIASAPAPVTRFLSFCQISSAPRFWRDSTLPSLYLTHFQDGRQSAYLLTVQD